MRGPSAGLLSIPRLVLVTEHRYLVAAHGTHRRGYHAGTIDHRRPNLSAIPVGYHQDPLELDRFTLGDVKEIDIHSLVRTDFVLFTTGFDYGVNVGTSRTTANCSIALNAESTCTLAFEPPDGFLHRLFIDPEPVKPTVDDVYLLGLHCDVEKPVGV